MIFKPGVRSQHSQLDFLFILLNTCPALLRVFKWMLRHYRCLYDGLCLVLYFRPEQVAEAAMELVMNKEKNGALMEVVGGKISYFTMTELK